MLPVMLVPADAGSCRCVQVGGGWRATPPWWNGYYCDLLDLDGFVCWRASREDNGYAQGEIDMRGRDIQEHLL
eukprot:1945926-Alexandrium_andersonii.AAC.1